MHDAVYAELTILEEKRRYIVRTNFTILFINSIPVIKRSCEILCVCIVRVLANSLLGRWYSFELIGELSLGNSGVDRR